MSTPTICIAGKNTIAVNVLLFLIEYGYRQNLIACPNENDTGKSSWQPSLLRFASTLGIPVVTIDEAKRIDNLIFLSLEYDKIVKPSEFKSNRLYNVHFSKLPAYKGVYTSVHPILNQEKESGVTLHVIDAGIDTGRILKQISFTIHETWTARDLYFKYLAEGTKLVQDMIPHIIENQSPYSFAQPPTGSSYFSRKSIDFKNLNINLNDTAYGLINKFRGYSFREFQSPKVHNIEVGGWKILPSRSTRKAGSIIKHTEDEICVATIDYDIHLSKQRIFEWFNVSGDTPESYIETLKQEFINITDENGWTPLIKASFKGDYKLCKILLRNGADANSTNYNGTTPIMYCQSTESWKDISKLLISYGADVMRQDKFGFGVNKYHPDQFKELTKIQ